MGKERNFKEFGISSWAVENRTTVFLITAIIVFIGWYTYQALPKENFPEIQIPTIYIGTPYPGTSPADMENLVTRKIEKELKSIDGVKKITSNSIQDYSIVVVEFESTVDLTEAKREVQEGVDRAKSELPSDLPQDPSVQDILLSEIPIIFCNLYGDLDLVTMKRYAEKLQDEIESMPEINRVEMVGALSREIQVNVDLFKMEMAGISFNDIERAIASENVIISGGQIDVGNYERALRVSGEFKSIEDIRNIVVKGVYGNPLYLRDFAEVKDGFKDRESIARLDEKPVITLNVIKKSGENLIFAIDKIRETVADWEQNKLPTELKVELSNDQSVITKRMLSGLINTIIIGFILVTLVLMFFMGLRDSLFVGLSVPLSSFIAFMVLPVLGFTLNMVVLFSFILALGIVVDNAIVVIENTYRIYNSEDLSILDSAKKAAGEVIGPVFAGTLTTMAPFIPLTFWEGTIGEFMFFLPITIMITLTASLIVAYVINPVFAVQFMKKGAKNKSMPIKGFLLIVGLLVVICVVSYLTGQKTFGNVLVFAIIFALTFRFLLNPAIKYFQEKIIPAFMSAYRKVLEFSLQGARPWVILYSSIGLLVFSFFLIGARAPKVVFFPEADPNFVFIFTALPIGTDIDETDRVTAEVENRVKEVLGENNPLVKSMITNIAIGANEQNDFSRNASPNKSKITIEFVEFQKRNGISTEDYMSQIRENTKGIPGAQVTVEKEQSGPPTAKPVNIEISAEDFSELQTVATQLLNYLDSLDIPGVEELKWDLELNKPEVVINVNRTKASELGISTAQVGMAVRTAVFGKEVSKFRENEDEFPIQVRLAEKYRKDLGALLNQKLTFRNMSDGQVYVVPLSAVASVEYDNSFGGINRLDLEKVVTVYSNILAGFNPAEVVGEVKEWIAKFEEREQLPSTVTIDMTGETKEQEETAAFLGKALMFSILLIFLILVAQFNSLTKVFIILFQIILSLVGVFLGFALTGMDVSVVMVGVGIISLAGVVVNNGILLLDFIGSAREGGMGMRKAIIEGGAVRFTPILLTASSTILGLIPMAVALNIDFATLITDFNPQIWFGGDNASFWGPLAWTIIFGLTFATIVTLIVVPVMYYISFVRGIWLTRFWKWVQMRWL